MEAMGRATTRQTVFRDETALTESYVPEAPVGRESLITQLHAALEPITHRNPPVNVALVGPPGTGKTTTVTTALDQLEEDSRVTTAVINCWQYNTRPALLTELLIQLGYPAPRKGRPVDERLSTLREWLAKSDGAVIALDEFDRLTDQTDVIYDLREIAAQTENHLGLVLVSNHPPKTFQFEARSQSRFNYRTLTAEPYTADDLATILHHRVEQAFRPGTISSEAIMQIATAVADSGGDCRLAFTVLLQAGRQADQDHASEVTTAHIQAGLAAHDVQ